MTARGCLGTSFAGLAAGAVVIPQAMAYATVANLPVQVGLYTCMVPMAVYALLGGSRTLSVSTTSTIAILTASTLMAAGLAAGSSDPTRTLAMLTLLVGAILLIARVLRLGGLMDNISEATLTGVKIGVGLTVAAGQLPKLLGIPGNPSADNFFSDAARRVRPAEPDQRDDLDLLGRDDRSPAGDQAGRPKAPAPLVAVVGGILVVALTSIEDHLSADRPRALRAAGASRAVHPPLQGSAPGRVRDRDHGVPGDARSGPDGAAALRAPELCSWARCSVTCRRPRSDAWS